MSIAYSAGKFPRQQSTKLEHVRRRLLKEVCGNRDKERLARQSYIILPETTDGV